MNYELKKGVVLTPDDFIGVDWLAKFKEIGLNTLGLHSGGGPGHNVLEHLGDCASTEFHEKVKAAGIDYEYELHAPHDLLPRDVFNTHPEFFIQPMGPKKERVTTGNWCGGTKAALDTIAANGAALGMKLNPSTHRHFFWGEDLNDGWCHCDKCAPYSPSDQNLKTANAIAAKLEETDPEASVGCIAYHQTIDPPELIRPRKNVFLEFAPIHRCYEHAIDDPNCAINRQQWKTLLGLLEVFNADTAHILEYWLDSSKFSGWKKPAKKPECRVEIVQKDIEAYYRLGIRSFTTFAVYMDGVYFDTHGDQELRDYAAILNTLH